MNAIVTVPTATIAVTLTAGAVVEAALIATVSPVVGGVQTVAPPLVVCAGANEPQGAGVQVQSTPAFWASFITVAAMLAV